MFIQSSQGMGVTIYTEKTTITLEGNAESTSDIITFSQYSKKPKQENSLFWPGEYEIKGCMFKGIETDNGAVVFVAQIEGIHVVHLGCAKELSMKTLDSIENIDILILPIAEGFLTAEEAKKMLANIETRIVIPVGDQASQLLPLIGATEVLPEVKLKVAASSLPIDKMEVMLLQ